MTTLKGMEDALMERFGTNVRRYRLRLRMKQEELARKASYANHTAISNIEHGRTMPTLAQGVRLADALQVPLEALLNGPGSEDLLLQQRLVVLAQRLSRPARQALVELLALLPA